MYENALLKNFLLNECVFVCFFRINFCHTIQSKATFSFIKCVNFFHLHLEWNRSGIYGRFKGLKAANLVLAFLWHSH